VVGKELSEEKRKKHGLPAPAPHHAYVVVPGTLIRDAQKGLTEE
jgi:hypothetical protein